MGAGHAKPLLATALTGLDEVEPSPHVIWAETSLAVAFGLASLRCATIALSDWPAVPAMSRPALVSGASCTVAWNDAVWVPIGQVRNIVYV